MTAKEETASPAPERPGTELRVQRLTASVTLLVWEGEAGGRRASQLCATIAERRVRPPFAHISVASDCGRQRNIMAVGGDAAAIRRERICVSGSDGAVIAVANAIDDPSGRPVAFAPEELIIGVDRPGRIRIARLLLELVPSLFRVGNDAEFAAACRRLAAALAPNPPALHPFSALFGSCRLASCTADAALGVNLSAMVIGSAQLEPVPFPPAFANATGEDDARRLFIVYRRSEQPDRDAVLVVFGDHGMICRRIGSHGHHLPSMLTWLREAGADRAAARRYVLDCLAHLGKTNVQAAALLREVRLLFPSPQVRSVTAPLAAGADLVIASAAGVFVKGWLDDPHALAEAICLERQGVTHTIDIHALIRFPHRSHLPKQRAGGPADGEALLRAAEKRRGFAFFIPQDGADNSDEPCRIALRLRSGARLAFAEGPGVMPPDLARDAILAAVPAAYLTPRTIAEAIAPSALALHQKHEATLASLDCCEIIDIGRVPEAPSAAIISLVADDPLLMRCRASLFTSDPRMDGVEVIHILDGTQDRQEVAGFLHHIHAAYGLAGRLVVMPRAATAAAMLNAGAGVARAPVLVALGKTVLPERPNWIGALVEPFQHCAKLGIIGARLVREDHALWNDGLNIGLDRGAWDIHPIRAGFPRALTATGRIPRPVRGVSPGCIAMLRSVFTICGGFSQRYLSLDHSLADLCLTAAAAGFETRLTAEPTLFRLDPPATNDHERLALDPRAEIDRRLLERKWRSRLMGASARPQPDRLTRNAAGAPSADAPIANGQAA